jgi:hypothetical protein
MTDAIFLESRIARLEKSARRWRLAACSLGLAAVAALAMGQGIVITGGGAGGGGMNAPNVTTDNLTVNKSFTLNDSNGNARIVFSSAKNEPSITLKDKDDHTLLSIAVEKDAANILIQDAKGKKLFAAP